MTPLANVQVEPFADSITAKQNKWHWWWQCKLYQSIITTATC